MADETMTVRSVRLPDALWQTYVTKAAEQGVKVSEVLRDALETQTFETVGNYDLPVAPADTAWDGEAAATRVSEFFTDADGNVDTEGVAKAFLWRDGDNFTLGFADVIDGDLQIVPDGAVEAAAGVAGLDVSEEDRAALEGTACELFDAVREAVPDFPDCPTMEEPAVEEAPMPEMTLDHAGPTDTNTITHPTLKNSDIIGEGGGCGCEHSTEAVAAVEATNPTSDEGVAAIVGTGHLSESEDPETQVAILRVKELLTEGAVGVSILSDLDPNDMPEPAVLDKLMAEGNWEEVDRLLAGLHQRPRHVAIVDTPAFSDARLTLNDDGSVSGPITFEGPWTGDVRRMPYGSLVWDENLLPIPIIWDRADGDHTGMTVGYIDELERQDGVTSSMVGPSVVADDVQPVLAAAGTGALPARFFAKFKSTEAVPLHVDAPDENGLRRVWGHVVPHGVCHRSDMGACFQYPADVDPNLSSFHTGFQITLDDGTEFRPGALTYSGMHLDTQLAKRGVGHREANRHREDSNRVFAMVKGWPDQFGLAVSGILAADVSANELIQVLSCSPSVELWPAGRGRTLVGAHIVPTPAWPVAAAAGEAQLMTSTQTVEVEDADDLLDANEAEQAIVDLTGLSQLMESVSRMERALALLVRDRIADGIPDIEPAPVVD